MSHQLPLHCVAFDCGNSSLRVVVGTYDGKKVTTDVVSQVPNSTIELNGIYYWDILYIFDSLRKGLREAVEKYKTIDSIGICTWGVDFGLLDETGTILSNPLSYRNTIGDAELSKLSEIERRWMFEQTGIQNNRINSLYQLSGIKRITPSIVNITKKMLLIPDLLGFLFTGAMNTEFSIVSSTQMLDVKTGEYAQAVLEKFGIEKNILQPLLQHGEVIGNLKDSIADELGIPPCPVICVPSHDTACAVTSVPTQEDDFIFISSGTWSLIGTELQHPLVNDTVFERDFANEGGVFNSITLLKNSTGMHILQCIKKELEIKGQKFSWDEIVEMARQYQGKVSLFNPNSFQLFNPKSMIETIQNLIVSENKSIQHVIAAAYTSLSYSYRFAIEQIQEITGISYQSIYIVGGGSQNHYLNQLTANITGKNVIAGPKEATSLGNIGVQLVHHLDDFDLKKIRKMVQQSEEITYYSPEQTVDKKDYDLRFAEYLKLLV
ncbi:MAG: rhamnulokinase family protein [Anaerolineaceae bacterium]